MRFPILSTTWSLAWLLSFAAAAPVESTDITTTPRANITGHTTTPSTSSSDFTSNSFSISTVGVDQTFQNILGVDEAQFAKFRFNFTDATTVDEKSRSTWCYVRFHGFDTFKPFDKPIACELPNYTWQLTAVQSPTEPPFKCKIELFHTVQLGSKVYVRQAAIEPPGLNAYDAQRYKYDSLAKNSVSYPDGDSFNPVWTTTLAPAGAKGDPAKSLVGDNI